MIELAELRDSAAQAFPPDGPLVERDEAWARVVELGWLLVELHDEHGGLGLGRAAAAAIINETGKALIAAPLVPALLGLRALAGRAEWIERVCAGAYIPLNMLPGSVERNGDGTLDGQVHGLFEADMASHVLIGAGGYRLVPLDANGVRIEERPLWDVTRRMFTLHLDRYRPDPALTLAEGAAAQALHDDIARSAFLFLAADSLGGSEAALAMTIEYLKVRRQFDRPLAMFQALKHRCADLRVRLSAADALLWARAGACEDALLWRLGGLKALADETYGAVCEEAIQLHGGIGLTMEYPVHRHFKRAALNAALCGGVDHHCEAAGRAALAELAPEIA